MAEILGLISSIIAVEQVADRLIGLCRYYIGTAVDTKKDLRAILIEVSSLKGVLESVQALAAADPDDSAALQMLNGEDGPIQGCQRTLGELERHFPTKTELAETETREKGGESHGSHQKTLQVVRSLKWPFHEKKARKLLDEISRYRATIDLALAYESSRDIKYVKHRVEEDQRQKFHQWLEHTDPSPNHLRACKLHETHTNQWVLRLQRWKDWRSRAVRFLWIHGIPGAGKTVLASFLTQQLEPSYKNGRGQESVGVSYYYCYFGHKQDETESFLRWTVSQLCRQAENIPSCIFNLYNNRSQPSIKQLCDALRVVLESFDVAFIIIDAVDESDPREELIELLKTLVTDDGFAKIQLLATSREYVDIESSFLDIAVPISMSDPEVEKDIRHYICVKLESKPKFKRWPESLRKEIEEALTNGAKGMFQWVFCQLVILEKLRTESDIRNALKTLPKTLYETYERILLGIPETDRYLARRALLYICGHQKWGETEKEMSTELLEQAIFYNIEGELTMDDCYALREICGCLVVFSSYRGRKGFVTFAHYTVQEFLFSYHIANNPDSELCFFALSDAVVYQEFAKMILEVATCAVEKKCFNNPSADSTKFLLPWSLLAVKRLLDAYQEVSAGLVKPVQSDLLELFLKVIDRGGTNYSYLVDIYTRHNTNPLESVYFHDDLSTNETSPKASQDILQFAALAIDQFPFLLRAFLRDRDAEVLLNTHVSYTPLGHFGKPTGLTRAASGRILSELAYMEDDRVGGVCTAPSIEALSSVFPPTDLLAYCSAIHYHETMCMKKNDMSWSTWCMLKSLLDKGADPETQEYAMTPLQLAVERWDYEGVKALLEHKADPNAIGKANGKIPSGLGVKVRWSCASPLYINRVAEYALEGTLEGAYLSTCGRGTHRRQKIEKLLLKYGAEEFFRTPNENSLL